MAGGLNRNITVRLLADTSNFTAGMAKVSGESQKTATTMEAAGGKSKLITTGHRGGRCRRHRAGRGRCQDGGGLRRQHVDGAGQHRSQRR